MQTHVFSTSVTAHMDAGMQRFLAAHHARILDGEKQYSAFGPVQLRKRFNENFHASRKTDDLTQVERVIEHTIKAPEGHSIRLRIYYPKASGQDSDRKVPVLMYFHGGGFVIRDDMDVYDQTCRRMCQGAQCSVVAVDYRLSPENPFPAAPEDCYTATKWVLEHGKETLGVDTERFGVWGESCGGNLAAVVPAMLRDRWELDKHVLKLQIVVSPMLADHFETQSYLKKGSGEFVLTVDTMTYFWSHYVSHAVEECRGNAYCMPLRQKDITAFERLPKALVVSAEDDPLCDDGFAYAERLKQARVDVEYRCHPGVIHGFLEMGHFSPAADAAFQDIIKFARNGLRE
jgi:acetyl esterase